MNPKCGQNSRQILTALLLDIVSFSFLIFNFINASFFDKITPIFYK